MPRRHGPSRPGQLARRVASISLPRLPDASQPDVFTEMTLVEHLAEVKSRVIRMGLAIVAGLVVGFWLATPVLEMIASNVNNEQGLDIRNPTDNLTVIFKVALYIAIGVTSPVLLYQVIAFLAPGLTNREKRVVYTALPFVTLLFVGGAAYALLFAIPQALRFLSNLGGDIFQDGADAQETVSFYLTVMLGLGLAFQLPLVMFVLARINVVSAAMMRKYWRFALIGILIVAAIITPTTDPFNLFLVAGPLYVLYELGILLSRLFATPGRDRTVQESASGHEVA